MFEGLTVGVAVVVPLVTAFIGYSTNWAAVKMIFHPLEFVGVGPIGWQGVLPRKQDTFADDVAVNTGKVMSARDLAERLHPDEMEEALSARLDAELPVVAAEVAELIAPGVWAELAPEARNAVVAQLRAEASRVAREVFEDLQGISDEILDLHSLVVGLLTGDNVGRLVRLFQRLGRRELRFIVYYGGVFGLLVGVVQVLLFGLLGRWWTMPIVGVLVGLATNWLAIQMIFRPREPRRFGPVRYQGMFPKRQAEIAHEFGATSAEEIFTPANLFRLVTEGEAGTRIARVVLERVSHRLDEHRPTLALIAGREVDDRLVEQVKALLVLHVSQRVPDLRSDLEDVVREKLGVAHLVESRMASMSKIEFERLLRGVFEQDEWILITIGGVLGGLVGLLQGAIVLALA